MQPSCQLVTLLVAGPSAHVYALRRDVDDPTCNAGGVSTKCSCQYQYRLNFIADSRFKAFINKKGRVGVEIGPIKSKISTDGAANTCNWQVGLTK
jgi:hypothetical protein